MEEAVCRVLLSPNILCPSKVVRRLGFMPIGHIITSLCPTMLTILHQLEQEAQIKTPPHLKAIHGTLDVVIPQAGHSEVMPG